jgi:alpha-ketoglutarate-dependent taurine dioxygenase
MKTKLSEIFSFSEAGTENFKNTPATIDLVSCPLKEMMCEVHLSVVNKNYAESEKYRREKDFQKSIETLKIAFYKTVELMEHPCTKCTQLYHSNIIESMVTIHSDLAKMSKGLFGKKRYLSSYNKVDSFLKEIENAGFSEKFQLNESKERFLGNHLN